MASSIWIRYEGLEADGHVVDLRRLGEAFIGIDRLVHGGLVALTTGQMPRKGARFVLQLRAKEPIAGSWETEVAIAAGWMLPVVHEMFYTASGEIAWRFISWVLNMTGGRAREAEMHYGPLAEVLREIHRGRFESDEAQRRFLLDVLDRVQGAAKDAVSPVGRSAATFAFRPGGGDPGETVIDEATAEVIRSGGELVVGEMEEFLVLVDGLIHHNKQLRVAIPQEPGRYYAADVRDPAFDAPENVYTQAVANRGWLKVRAKPVRKPDGSLHRLYVMDAAPAEPPK